MQVENLHHDIEKGGLKMGKRTRAKKVAKRVRKQYATRDFVSAAESLMEDVFRWRATLVKLNNVLLRASYEHGGTRAGLLMRGASDVIRGDLIALIDCQVKRPPGPGEEHMQEPPEFPF